MVELPHAGLHLLARLERDHAFRLNRHTLPRARVAGHPGLPLFDLKNAEIPQLDPTLFHQGVDQGVERLLHQLLGTELRQFDLLGDRSDNIFLGHGLNAPHGGCDSSEVYDWQVVVSTIHLAGQPGC